MWLVKIALQRPYTFLVMAVLLLVFGPLAIARTPVDIFPNIRIPVVGIIWSYAGLPPQEMADRITNSFNRVLPTAVNDIEHIDSNALLGVSVSKVYLHPRANLAVSMSQAVASGQYWLRNLPQGTTPPQFVVYSASSVPVLQLALSSSTISQQGLYDAGNIFVRTQLAGIPGLTLPFPYGGRQRQVQVDLDPRALQAHGLSAQDVQAAILSQNLIIPAGTEKIGPYEYLIRLNGSPDDAAALNNVPVKVVDGAMVFVRDVAHVRDGAPPQTNLVRLDGKPGVLMTVQKTGEASTVQVVDQVKARLPKLRAAAPSGLAIQAVGDQSVFVRAAIVSVVREGIVAAGLTALMILLFLGSWRSTLIIATSIPLSILASMIALSALGETINLMTLGGLALAVGILVDDATVAIENINAHLERGEPVESAILAGAQEIAVPAFVATLCICIVFLPMFFLEGVPKFLFVPMAEAIVFAMIASYILSRTLVPTLAKLLLRAHGPGHAREANWLGRLQGGFQAAFDRLGHVYARTVAAVVQRRRVFAPIFGIACVLSLALVPALGTDFFPAVDAGQIKLHMRAHAGTRVEETGALADQVEALVRRTIPAPEIQGIVDNIGVPVSGTNLTYSTSAPTGTADADIYITLGPKHRPTAGYIAILRRKLRQAFPGASFAFLPADSATQILNFGAPSPIDVQVVGKTLGQSTQVATALLSHIAKIPGVADARIHQDLDSPEFDIAVDRSRSQDSGLTQRDVANNLLISLAGSFQTQPTFWLDPKNGVSYPIVSQVPQTELTSLDDLRGTPITGAQGSKPQLLGALGHITRTVGPAVVTDYNAQPAIDIMATNAGRDLGGVTRDIGRVVAEAQKHAPAGVTITLRGQVATMNASFRGLFVGLGFAILLVYLVIVVNFQSLLDPLIIISALPAAVAGIVWMLFLTHTTLSVPALTGAIMTMGVATANSILVVSFGRERMVAGDTPAKAAVEAARARFRPVLMTALAMIIGMLPMALGLGEGGEQNAPLGRAVIGGLLWATAATLLFVPAVFTLLHGQPRRGLATVALQPPVAEN